MSDLMADDQLLLVELSRGRLINQPGGQLNGQMNGKPSGHLKKQADNQAGGHQLDNQFKSLLGVLQNGQPNDRQWSKQFIPGNIEIGRLDVGQPAQPGVSGFVAIGRGEVSPPPEYTSALVDGQFSDLLSAVWQPYNVLNHSLDGGTNQLAGSLYNTSAESHNQSVDELYQSIDASAYDYF